jgi:hypothetical protein
MVGVQVYIVAVLILGTLILITRVRFHWVSYVTVGMAVAIWPSIVFYYSEGACRVNMVTHLRWGRFKELISQSTDLYAPINNSLKMVQFRHEAINVNPSIYWDPNGVDEKTVLVVRALMGTENKGFLYPHECALFLDSRLLARTPSQVQWFVVVGEPDYGQDSHDIGFSGNLKIGVLVFAWPSKTLTMDCVLYIGIKYSSTPRPAQVYRAIAKALAGLLTITEGQFTADINTSARDSDSQTGRLIAWWRFDEVGGDVAEDSSGNALHGTLMGDPQRVPGRIGNALHFDGKDDYVDCGNDPLLDLGRPMTIAAWIKIPAFKSWAAPIITKGNTAWRLQQWSNTNRLEFKVSHPLSQRAPILLGGSNLDDGQWHHVVATYEYRKMSLYIDGKLERSCSLAWNDTEAHNDKPVHIGANAEHETSKWSGMIDDVRIYNYALAPDEVADLIPPL